MYTLDTNAIIYFYEDDPDVVPVMRQIFSGNWRIYVSTVTEIELFSHPKLSEVEILKIDTFLKIVSIIPLDSRIARQAGFLRRIYRLPLADSAIAATTLFTGSTLITRNVKDFERIPDFSIRKI